MMILVEFGANESDSPDEIVYKKLSYIEQRAISINRDIGALMAKPKSKKYDAELVFYNNTLSRYLTEKAETLRNIGCRGCSNDCHCIYCTRVLPDRLKSIENTGFGNVGVA